MSPVHRLSPARYTVEKTQIECYKILSQGGDFADISLNYKDEAGRVSIASSYGNWSFYWSHCGEPFKKHLIGLPIEAAAAQFDEFQNVNKTLVVTRSFAAFWDTLWQTFLDRLKDETGEEPAQPIVIQYEYPQDTEGMERHNTAIAMGYEYLGGKRYKLPAAWWKDDLFSVDNAVDLSATGKEHIQILKSTCMQLTAYLHEALENLSTYEQ